VKYITPHFEIIDLLSRETDNIIVAITSDALVCREISSYIEVKTISDDIRADEISIITPETMIENSLAELIYHDGCAAAEVNYFSLIAAGVSPKIAFKILPLGIRTDFYVSGSKYEWKKMFRLTSVDGVTPETRVILDGINKALNKKYGDSIPLI